MVLLMVRPNQRWRPVHTALWNQSSSFFHVWFHGNVLGLVGSNGATRFWLWFSVLADSV